MYFPDFEVIKTECVFPKVTSLRNFYRLTNIKYLNKSNQL